MTSDIIEVVDPKHSLWDVKAVDRIGFSVGEGEIFSFLEPNESGKSTARGKAIGVG